jgi:hypothetical protein
MQGNKFLDVLAGVIIGSILGIIFYTISAKCLLTGTIPVDGLLLPKGVNSAILLLGLKYGGGIGAIVGFIIGLGAPVNAPRGQMSGIISCLSFLVCTIVAFVMYGSQLRYMAIWKIAATFLYVVIFFFLAIPFAHFVSFIERIRE